MSETFYEPTVELEKPEESLLESLRPKELIFVMEYCNPSNQFNQTRCAIKAGYSEKTARQKAYELINTERIRLAIDNWIQNTLERYKDAFEYQIIEIYRRRAFYDPLMFVDHNGNIKIYEGEDGEYYFTRTDEPVGAWAVCIEGIETKYYGQNANVKKTIVKLANREKALDMLTKYMELLSPEQTGGTTINNSGVLMVNNPVSKEEWLSLQDETGIKKVEINLKKVKN